MTHEKALRLPGQLRSVVGATSAVATTSLAAGPIAAPSRSLPEPRPSVDVAKLLQALADAAQQLERQRAKLLQDMRSVTVDLAIAVARRLCRSSLETGTFDVAAMVRDVVERLETQGPAVIALHPSDLALLQAQTPEGWDSAAVRLVADPALRRGCCVARGREIAVMSDVEKQLDELQQQMRDAALRVAEPGHDTAAASPGVRSRHQERGLPC